MADDLDRIIAGTHPDPHTVLGPHIDVTAPVARILRRGASSVSVLLDGKRLPATRIHRDGIFLARLPREAPDYRLDCDGVTVDDPYRHLPTVGDVDLYLIGEGRHERLWSVLGAQPRDGGVAFTVWAPNAGGIRVIGDAAATAASDGWGAHDGWPMRRLGTSGVWELFLPEASAGQRYKFRVLGADGRWSDRADPMARGTEVPPQTASVVAVDAYHWSDHDWLAARATRTPHSEPIAIYEVHLGSWRKGLSYRDLADQLTEHVVRMGFTHVEFLPVMEHPFGGSWGYQVTGYYAPTARFGAPDDLRYLIDRLHRAGIGVLLDWVPAHFPRDNWALARFDGTPLYEHADPHRGEHPDWGTLVFDYGRPEVRNFLVANALYWLSEFHVDGLRVDAVASMLYLDYSREDGQWTPNVHGGRENLEAISFMQELNATVYKHHPGVVMVAEESTAWPGVTQRTDGGGLGFGFKWNMGWMHDTLAYLSHEPIHRQYHHNQLTFAMVYAYSENYVLPLSHDEVVHLKGSLVAKMPGDQWQRMATLRALYAFMWAHPGKKLLFMGQEFADENEWQEQHGLDWATPNDFMHAGVAALLRDLNSVYAAQPALWAADTDPAGFRWLVGDDASHNTAAFVRQAPGAKPLVCVVNFAAIPQDGYLVGLPVPGAWREVINTDAAAYGGGGVGNLGSFTADDLPWHDCPASAAIRVPPLGALWLTPAT
jgi:1,4-alpha-glucan branching enzyme